MSAAFLDVPRKRCVVCGLMTRKWQRINGGPWHCYDQCRDALAAAARRAKTAKRAECEASQSGGDSRNAPEQSA